MPKCQHMKNYEGHLSKPNDKKIRNPLFNELLKIIDLLAYEDGTDRVFRNVGI